MGEGKEAKWLGGRTCGGDFIAACLPLLNHMVLAEIFELCAGGDIFFDKRLLT
jgi:hypothetical protein